jgi:hypothetical protein
VFVLIPKKKIRLATRRNRVRRLLREAVRGDAYFQEERKIHWLRVLGMPPGLTLQETKRVLRGLTGAQSR